MSAAKRRKQAVGAKSSVGGYRLEDQVGFLIRQASQRHMAIFSRQMTGDLTPTQWAALVKVAELEAVSQNQLGRDTAMDAATIKGVVDRLLRRGFVSATADPGDGRRSVIRLTPEGAAMVTVAQPIAAAITLETLSGLSGSEQHKLLELLRKIS